MDLTAPENPRGETDPNQEPISAEMVSVYLDVVENADRIQVRPKGQSATLKYEKDVNGVVVVVEAVRTRQKTLAFTTMWIRKASVSQ